MKKLFESLVKKNLFLLFVICVMGVGIRTLNEKKVVATAEEESIPEGYVEIRTISDLANINNDSDGNYILMNDIDLSEATAEGGSWDSGCGWKPLNRFSGVLDGNGHTIKGMHIYGDVQKNLGIEYAGLFQEIYKGTVKNLRLQDVDINISNIEGGFGTIAGKTTFTEAKKIDYEGERTAVGQKLLFPTIENCGVSGNIYSAGIYVGGVVGYNSGNVMGCYNNANITSSQTDVYTVYVGGVVGFVCYDSIYAHAIRDFGYLREDKGYFGELDEINNSGYYALTDEYEYGVLYREYNYYYNYFKNDSSLDDNSEVIAEEGCNEFYFNNNYNTGNVQSLFKNEYYEDVYVGGIIGGYKPYYKIIDDYYYSLNSNKNTISNCYNIGNVKVIGLQKGGGILGVISAPDFIDEDDQYDCSYVDFLNIGEDHITEINNFNNFACLDTDYVTDLVNGQRNCYYLNSSASSGCSNFDNISGSRSPLSDSQMKESSNFIGFDFESIWELDGYSKFIYPQIKLNRQIKVSNLEWVTKPDKVTYKQGEDLDVSGGNIRVTYEDDLENEFAIKDKMISDYDKSIIGKQQVKVNYGDKYLTWDIEVEAIPATEITITSENEYNQVAKGDQLQLTASFLPENATYQDVEWKVIDGNEYGIVDENGIVTGRKVGKFTVAATNSEGVVGTLEITVLSHCVELTLDKYELTMSLGDEIEIFATLSPNDCTDKVTWTSENNNVVKVVPGDDIYGLSVVVMAVGEGVTNVKGVTDNGKEVVCKVSVVSNKIPINTSVATMTSVNNASSVAGTKNSKNSTTNTNIPNKVKIKKVKSGKGFIKVKFEKDSFADGYEVKLTGGIKKLIDTEKNSVKIKVKSGKKCKVKVRAYAYTDDDIEFGSWSKVKKVKVK